MSGLFGIIEAGKQSLFAQQSALQILNHNVANAGNPAYTRQRVLLGARSILGEMGLPQSGGVQILGVQRITDHFLLGRVTRAQGEYGEQSALRASYDLMELAFGEPVDTSLGETGLGDDLRSFLDSWQLTLNPDGGGDSSDLA
ncbi:MAG: hypothetical protein QGG80_08060, partial [Candidatus Krumholzibacteria bacterium]|nr:hypothetical protein [Candidatus Krumholzibacteria bacterium]